MIGWALPLCGIVALVGLALMATPWAKREYDERLQKVALVGAWLAGVAAFSILFTVLIAWARMEP